MLYTCGSKNKCFYFSGEKNLRGGGIGIEL
jgi:hypothetical protein